MLTCFLALLLVYIASNFIGINAKIFNFSMSATAGYSVIAGSNSTSIALISNPSFNSFFVTQAVSEFLADPGFVMPDSTAMRGFQLNESRSLAHSIPINDIVAVGRFS